MQSIEELFLQNTGTFSLLQKKSKERSQELGYPHQVKTQLPYMPLHRLARAYDPVLQEDWQSYIVPECAHSYLVVIDGIWRKELSCVTAISQVRVLSLQEAWKGSYASWLSYRTEQWIKEEEDPFVLLNGLHVQDGLFLYVPPRIQIETPVQILFIQHQACYVRPRVHLFLGAHAHMTCFTRLMPHQLFNGVFDIALEEGACCSLVRDQHIQRGSIASRSSLKKESRLNMLLCNKGGEAVQEEEKILLLGKEATATLQSIAIVSDHQQAHLSVSMEHRAPHTYSHQLVKHVLSDFAKTSFTGKIVIDQEAQKAEAYQLHNSLLLSDDGAMAASKPSLKIFADDVKASHGSTVSQVDQEQLSYLQSRGIAKKTAHALLVKGFYRDVLDKIPIPSLASTLLLKCIFLY